MGNFLVSAEADLEIEPPVDALVQEMLEAGFKQTLQRIPASRAEKAVAGYDKRPEKFSRSKDPSMAYSPESAEKLKVGFGTQEVVEKQTLTYRIADVTQHVPNSGAEGSMKRATNFVELIWESDEAKKMLVALGMPTALTAPKDELIAFAHSKGLGAATATPAAAK
jgi:hypothetical protein